LGASFGVVFRLRDNDFFSDGLKKVFSESLSRLALMQINEMSKPHVFNAQYVDRR